MSYSLIRGDHLGASQAIALQSAPKPRKSGQKPLQSAPPPRKSGQKRLASRLLGQGLPGDRAPEWPVAAQKRPGAPSIVRRRRLKVVRSPSRVDSLGRASLAIALQSGLSPRKSGQEPPPECAAAAQKWSEAPRESIPWAGSPWRSRSRVACRRAKAARSHLQSAPPPPKSGQKPLASRFLGQGLPGDRAPEWPVAAQKRPGAPSRVRRRRPKVVRSPSRVDSLGRASLAIALQSGLSPRKSGQKPPSECAAAAQKWSEAPRESIPWAGSPWRSHSRVTCRRPRAARSASRVDPLGRASLAIALQSDLSPPESGPNFVQSKLPSPESGPKPLQFVLRSHESSLEPLPSRPFGHGSPKTATLSLRFRGEERRSQSARLLRKELRGA